jgi:hypothetical protein
MIMASSWWLQMLRRKYHKQTSNAYALYRNNFSENNNAEDKEQYWVTLSIRFAALERESQY